MTETDNAAIKYPTFNRRLIAASTDLILLFMIVTPIGGILALNLFHESLRMEFIMEISKFKDSQDPHEILQAAWNFFITRHVFEKLIIENLVQLTVIALYLLPCWMRYSATPGKMVAGIIIVDATSGLPMTKKQSIMRFLGYIAATLPLTLGFLPMLITKKRQGLHDMIANTVVVFKPKKKIETDVKDEETTAPTEEK